MWGPCASQCVSAQRRRKWGVYLTLTPSQRSHCATRCRKRNPPVKRERERTEEGEEEDACMSADGGRSALARALRFRRERPAQESVDSGMRGGQGHSDRLGGYFFLSECLLVFEDSLSLPVAPSSTLDLNHDFRDLIASPPLCDTCRCRNNSCGVVTG